MMYLWMLYFDRFFTNIMKNSQTKMFGNGRSTTKGGRRRMPIIYRSIRLTHVCNFIKTEQMQF